MGFSTGAPPQQNTPTPASPLSREILEMRRRLRLSLTGRRGARSTILTSPTGAARTAVRPPGLLGLAQAPLGK